MADDPDAFAKETELVERGETQWLPTPVVAETYYGVATARSETAEREVRNRLLGYPRIDVDEGIARSKRITDYLLVVEESFDPLSSPVRATRAVAPYRGRRTSPVDSRPSKNSLTRDSISSRISATSAGDFPPGSSRPQSRWSPAHPAGQTSSAEHPIVIT